MGSVEVRKNVFAVFAATKCVQAMPLKLNRVNYEDESDRNGWCTKKI